MDASRCRRRAKHYYRWQLRNEREAHLLFPPPALIAAGCDTLAGRPWWHPRLHDVGYNLCWGSRHGSTRERVPRPAETSQLVGSLLTEDDR